MPIKHHYSIYLVDCNSVSENDFGFRSCFPYGIDEGPCIFDDQCKDNLFCGYKNCPASFGNDSNCCGRNQFKSPNYPNNYFPNDIKTWHITSPFGLKINLQFDSFHVRLIGENKNKKSTRYPHFLDWKWLLFWKFENITILNKVSNFPNSQTEGFDIKPTHIEHRDSLTIYDGSDDQSTQIEKLSGDLESFGISSTGNSLFVIFESDYYKNYAGFFATIFYGNIWISNNT